MRVDERLRRDGTPVTSPQPARGYSWEPFQPGNLKAMRHGARSERVVGARAQQIREMLVADFPYLASEVFQESVERYCRAEARARLLSDYCMEKAEREGVEKVPPSLWQEASRAESNAMKAAQDCGLDAAGFARVARDLGLARSIGQRLQGPGLDALAADGRKIRQLRGRGA